MNKRVATAAIVALAAVLAVILYVERHRPAAPPAKAPTPTPVERPQAPENSERPLDGDFKAAMERESAAASSH